MILPGGTGEQEVNIDYTYDALNRLISAEYSNGTAFGYTYDAAGNVLTYAETHYGQTKVTTYTYDVVNQLLSASESGTVWYYTYDGNGSLIQTNPGVEVANGSTRYTYNTAGYLTKVENFTTEWQTQSEMTYDGLGNRLELTTYADGEGNTTRYVLNGGTILTAIGAESTTYYLYGLGAIGTLGESWSYMLQDGAGSTRQLVDEEGAVTLSVSYTPWGDTMEIYGSGMLNLGYLGGVYDAGTGLIYMGNGQYYDPSTGRFLTRGAQQDQNNPYTPWNSDPAGMLIAPLALLALVFGRKKTRTKFDQFVILFVIVLSVGLSVSACAPGEPVTIQTGDTSVITLDIDSRLGTQSAEITVMALNGTKLPTPIEIKVTWTPDNGEDIIPQATEAPTENVGYGCGQAQLQSDETKIVKTIDALSEYIFGDGSLIQAVSARANTTDVKKYLRRIMDEAGKYGGLNSNHLAYIYATAHVESLWGDFEERYKGAGDENAKRDYFESIYGKDTETGKILGNTVTWDGYTFLGRGFIHITGRGNYQKMSEALGLGDLLIDGETYGFAKAACGINCDGYDYVTKIAVVGMAEGVFTNIGLLSSELNDTDGGFDFVRARNIIGWPGDGSSAKADELAVDYATILSENCSIGGLSEGLTCICR